MNHIVNFGNMAIRAECIEAIVKQETGGVYIFAVGNNGDGDSYFVSDDFESVLIKWHAAMSTTQPKEKDESC